MADYGIVEAPDEYRAYAYLTRRCDLRCWYCNVPLVDAGASGELTPDDWRVIIDNLKHMGVGLITFGGGEPFLRQDLLLGAIPYAIKKGVYPVLLTDGRLVSTSDRALTTLKTLRLTGLNCLSVSIDNADDLDTLPDTDEGSRLKTFYGYRALQVARSIGMTDLGATAVLNTADPWPTVDVVKRLGGEGYDVRVSLVQTASSIIEVNTFQRAVIPETDIHPDLPQVAQWLATEGVDTYRVKNTPGYFDGVITGGYKNWACRQPGYLVVAPDGRLQLCQNVYGRNLRDNMNLTQATPDKAQYITLWQQDLEQYCPGCYINCNVDYENRKEQTP